MLKFVILRFWSFIIISVYLSNSYFTKTNAAFPLIPSVFSYLGSSFILFSNCCHLNYSYFVHFVTLVYTIFHYFITLAFSTLISFFKLLFFQGHFVYFSTHFIYLNREPILFSSYFFTINTDLFILYFLQYFILHHG